MRQIAHFVLTVIALSGFACASERWRLEPEQWCSASESLYSACYSKIERMRLAEVGDVVRRNNRDLVLRLKDGRTITRTNSPEGQEGFHGPDGAPTVSYYLYFVFPKLGQYLLKKQYWEGVGYEFIGMTTGAGIEVDALPVFSQDNEHFAVLVHDDYECILHSIQVWRANTDTIRKVFALDVDVDKCIAAESDYRGGFTLYEMEYQQASKQWVKTHRYGELVKGVEWQFRTFESGSNQAFQRTRFARR